MLISDEADYVAMSARIPPPLRNFQLCIFVQDFRREHAENSGGMPKPTCRAPAEIFSKLSLRVFAFLAQRSDRGAGHIRKRRTAESIVFVGTRKKIPEFVTPDVGQMSRRSTGRGPGQVSPGFWDQMEVRGSSIAASAPKSPAVFRIRGTTGANFYLRCTRARIEGRKLPLLAID